MRRVLFAFVMCMSACVAPSDSSVDERFDALNELNQTSEPDILVTEEREEQPSLVFLDDDDSPKVGDLTNPCVCSWSLEERGGMICLRRRCSAECTNQECEEQGTVCRFIR